MRDSSPCILYLVFYTLYTVLCALYCIELYSIYYFENPYLSVEERGMKNAVMVDGRAALVLCSTDISIMNYDTHINIHKK